jgi:hypothetical protein
MACVEPPAVRDRTLWCRAAPGPTGWSGQWGDERQGAGGGSGRIVTVAGAKREQ